MELGVDWQHYFFSMNSQPDDTFVAGGATDDFIDTTLSAIYRMR